MRDNEMDLLLRSFDDELGEGDRLELSRLLESSAEARVEHDRLRRLRDFVSRAATAEFAPRFADRVMAQVPNHRPTRVSAAPVRRARAGSWRVAGGFAVAAVVVMAAGLALWLQPRSVTVPYGATAIVEFSDGSVAELSSGSTLTYLRFWGRDERRVTLEGEAFFDVTEGTRPFIVETFNAAVSVLGTRFNVRAWPNDPIPETAVALESGRVHVSPLRPPGPRRESATAESSVAASRQSAGPVVLEPGQAASVVRDSSAVRPPKFIRLDHVVAWRSGGLAFIDQPVGAVINTIERRFDVEVQITDPDIQSRLLTYLNPHPRSAEDVLSDVCHTLDLHYRHTANGFEILP